MFGTGRIIPWICRAVLTNRRKRKKFLEVRFVIFKEVSCSSKMHPDFEIHMSRTLLIFGLQKWNDSDDDSSKDKRESDDDEDDGSSDTDYQGRRTNTNKRRRFYDPDKEEQQSGD